MSTAEIMTVSRNLKEWEWGRDLAGNPIKRPVPFNCLRGEPAVYGEYGHWYCTRCWQAKFDEPGEVK